MSHECGQGKLAKTTASVGVDHDAGQPQAYQKRQMQRDQDAASRVAQNFVDQIKLKKNAKGA